MNEIEILRKKKIDELRSIGKKEGINVAVRWNRKTLARKILEHRAIQQLDHNQAKPVAAAPTPETKRSPEFEALAGGDQKTTAQIHSVVSDSEVTQEPENIKDEGRGGARPGAGRPVGMTDEEARIRRLLDLEVPDLLVLKIIGAMCFFYGTKSGNPLQKEEVKKVALGATRELYYWFPVLQGRTSKWTLHTEAIEEMSAPFVTRGMANLLAENPEDSQGDNQVKQIFERIKNMDESQLDKLQAMLGIEPKAA